MKKFYIFILIICSISISAQNSPSLITEFSNSIIQEQPKYSQIFQKPWYDYKITSGKNSESFNPFFLPFKYINNTDTIDKNQHLTFPSLLSFKFDFVPDNYNSRHPSFIFQRDDKAKNALSPSVQEITKLMAEWQATYAFGGEITEYNNGFTGKMIVYDKNGIVILEKEYLNKTDYFKLMGLMVTDWMDFRKQKISAGLKKELFCSMTKSRESVRLYGNVFDVKRRTQDEWDVYESILKNDPDFGEVRFWYANQKGWSGADKTWINANKLQSCSDHLVLCGLLEFDLKYCKDNSLITKYNQKLNYAETILNNNIRIVSQNLFNTEIITDVNLLSSYIPIAVQNPNQLHLLEMLGYHFMHNNMPEKSIPLFISAYQSGFTENDNFFFIYLKLAEEYSNLGYYTEAEFFADAALNNIPDKKNTYIFLIKADILRETGRFSAAIDFYTKYLNIFKDDNLIKLKIILSAFETGNSKEINRIKNTYFSSLTPSGQYLINARESILSKDYKNGALMCNNALKSLIANKHLLTKETMLMELYENILIRTEIELLANDNKTAIYNITEAFVRSPHSRRVGFLLQKCYKDKKELLNQYIYVNSFIFTDDDFWRNFKFKYQTKISDTELINFEEEFKKISVKFYNLSGKENQYISQQYSPYYIEYIILKLIENNKNINLKKIITFYSDYAAIVSRISSDQERHTRIFIYSLLSDVPTEEKSGLIDYYEKKLKN